MSEDMLKSTIGLTAGMAIVQTETGHRKKAYRTEHDSIGDKAVPEDAYYGVQTLRAVENFRITGLSLHPEMINSLALLKKAAAITNREIGVLEPAISEAIVKACDEILEGKLRADDDAIGFTD